MELSFTKNQIEMTNKGEIPFPSLNYPRQFLSGVHN